MESQLCRAALFLKTTKKDSQVPNVHLNKQALEKILSKNTQLISLEKFKDLISNKKGAQIVTLITETEPRMRKTNNPYHGGVVKLSRVNGIINFNYGNSVNRQRTREGSVPNFQPLPRKWGTRLPGVPLVEHKGKLYLEIKIERSIDHEYLTPQGHAITEDMLRPWLQKSSSNKDHQGLEKELILRDYKLENIKAIITSGTTYIITY